MIEYNDIKIKQLFMEVFLFMDISQIPYYFSEYIMHFDKYIPLVMASYGSLIYFILFMIIFCETVPALCLWRPVRYRQQSALRNIVCNLSGSGDFRRYQ